MLSRYHNFSKKSYAIFMTELGTFTASATTNPMDTSSEDIGITIAEQRATIKYWQAVKYKTRIELNALMDMYSGIQDMRDFNYDSLEARRMRRAIYEKKDDIKQIRKNIEECRKIIHDVLADWEKICSL
jgi:hypothetical protein